MLIVSMCTIEVNGNLPVLKATNCRCRKASVTRTCFCRLSLAHRGLQRKVKWQRSKCKSQKLRQLYDGGFLVGVGKAAWESTHERNVSRPDSSGRLFHCAVAWAARPVQTWVILWRRKYPGRWKSRRAEERALRYVILLCLEGQRHNHCHDEHEDGHDRSNATSAHHECGNNYGDVRAFDQGKAARFDCRRLISL